FISMSSEWFIFYQNMYRKVNINPVNDKYFILKNTAEGRVPSDSVVEDGRDEDKKSEVRRLPYLARFCAEIA
ncbi:MAG TPA: hypothetical protein K8W12_01675, partial [Tidjanibacter sp.]|nr:hypothetical protein [Tidjanibacter sp.]